jgi:hypothetical protein
LRSTPTSHVDGTVARAFDTSLCLESLDDSCADWRETTIAHDALHNLQTFSVELDRSLRVDGRLFRFEIVVNRCETARPSDSMAAAVRKAITARFWLRVGTRGKPQLVTGDEDVLHNFRPTAAFSSLQIAEFKRDRVGRGEKRRRVG